MTQPSSAALKRLIALNQTDLWKGQLEQPLAIRHEEDGSLTIGWLPPSGRKLWHLFAALFSVLFGIFGLLCFAQAVTLLQAVQGVELVVFATMFVGMVMLAIPAGIFAWLYHQGFRYSARDLARAFYRIRLRDEELLLEGPNNNRQRLLPGDIHNFVLTRDGRVVINDRFGGSHQLHLQSCALPQLEALQSILTGWHDRPGPPSAVEVDQRSLAALKAITERKL